MPIIKDQQISDNSWRFIADDTPMVDGDITVSVKRWQETKPLLLKHSGKVGVRLAPNDAVEIIANDLDAISLIELDFPAFTDGRAFSHTRLLRDRYAYNGEIRAIGKFMADQVFYLHRVGVNAFEFQNPNDIQLALSAINDFSVRYQSSTQ